MREKTIVSAAPSSQESNITPTPNLFAADSVTGEPSMDKLALAIIHLVQNIQNFKVSITRSPYQNGSILTSVRLENLKN